MHGRALMHRILTICTGNICRSPMAELILRRAVQEAGLGDRVDVASAGTTGWEEGEPIDPRAAAELESRGISSGEHRARQATSAMLREADLILALDHDHVAPLQRIGGQEIQGRVRMLREFDPQAGEDLGIRDPWYGDESDFASSAQMIADAAPGVVEHVRRALAAGADPA